MPGQSCGGSTPLQVRCPGSEFWNKVMEGAEIKKQKLSTCSPMAPPLLKARLKKADPKLCTFDDDEINISVRRGELVWLKGPSGAGKTLSSLHVGHTR